MNREELIDKIVEVAKSQEDFGFMAEEILEIVDNELLLNDVRPPWAPKPWKWGPGSPDFDRVYKALSDRRLTPEQRDALLKLSGAGYTSKCKHCTRPGLRLPENSDVGYGLCWYHQNQVLDDPPFKKPYPPGTRYGLLKRSNLEESDG